MGLIPQVKCGRCDRTYSSLRSRCPYCGAHRHKKGKRTTDSDNATWKLIIGVLLIVVLIAAVIVILVTSAGDQNDAANNNNTPGNNANEGVENSQGKNPSGSNDDDSQQNDDDDNNENNGDDGQQGENSNDNNGEGENNGDGENNEGGNTPPTTVIASSIYAKTRYYNPVKDISLQKLGETTEATAVVTPSNVTSIPLWTSDNESAVTVIPDSSGMKATLTGVGKGTANITVSIDGLEYSFVVRSRAG